MKNPDRSELVKLADRLAALPTFKMATVVTVPGVACNERERDLIVTALRRLASSDGGVKVRELEWSQSPPPAHEHEPFVYWAAGLGGHYRAERDGLLWMAHDAFVWEQHPTQNAAKAAAQADYEARIRSVLITAPPADARMREALEDAEGIFEQVRLILINHLDEPVRSAFWKAIEGREKCKAALTAPGATTKSDGGESSLPTAGGFPVAATPSHVEETGVILPTRQGAGVERGMDQCVTGGESAATPPAPQAAGRALRDVAVERWRQRWAEGWTPEHDDGHDAGELARAAAAYALAGATSDFHRDARGQNEKLLREYENYTFSQFRQIWPWDWNWWKPKDRRRDLVRAGALILAEIERIDRAIATDANTTSRDGASERPVSGLPATAQMGSPAVTAGETATNSSFHSPSPAEAVSVDARRYRRLRVLGCAPAYSKHLEDGSVLRFTNLDEFVDVDLERQPSRGEADTTVDTMSEFGTVRGSLDKLGRRVDPVQMPDSLKRTIATCYGLLWHVTTDSKYVHRARRGLLQWITKDEQADGIYLARAIALANHIPLPDEGTAPWEI